MIKRSLDDRKRISLPEEYLGYLGWGKRSEIMVEIVDDEIHLKAKGPYCNLCGNPTRGHLIFMEQGILCRRCWEEAGQVLAELER